MGTIVLVSCAKTMGGKGTLAPVWPYPRLGRLRDMMWFGPGGWWMALWMLLFWSGVIVLVVWAVRAATDGSRRGEDGNRAIHILEERYARGEIDREEFEQRRSTLEGH